MTAKDVIELWMRGKVAESGNLATDGIWLFSYNTRIGRTVENNKQVLNLRGKFSVSTTTSKHVGWAIKMGAEVIDPRRDAHDRWVFPILPESELAILPTWRQFTIDEIRQYNARAGYHFFEPETMRLFNSRVLSDVYHVGDRWNIFITSERFMPLYGEPAKRLYTIRQLREDGGIDKIGEFQQYPSAAAARRAITSGKAFA